LIFESGPNGEKFTGEFVIVDRTAISSQETQGSAVVPLGTLGTTQLSAVGTVRSRSTSSGRREATTFCYATGDKGSTWEILYFKPESRANAQITPLLRFTRPFFKIRAPDLPEILPSAMDEPYNVV
jgi:hypothetical protein